jgi:hypothetical protein
MTTNTQALIERLRARVDSGRRAMGCMTLDAAGHWESRGGERIFVDRNPDGEEAATELERLTTALTDTEAKLAIAREAIQCLRNGYADAVSGYQYILQYHGKLHGVGFDRVLGHFEEWVTIPEREGLLAGSHHLARACLAELGEG